MIVTVALLPGWATGCASPVQGDYLSAKRIEPTSNPQTQDRLWQAIEETLRQNRFQPDRVDRRTGVITTMPVISQHCFEFWRRDVRTTYDLWEATLNPIRRWAEVTITRGDDDVWGEVRIIVHKERLSSPDRQFNSSGAAYQFFGEKLPSTTGMIRVTQEHDQWLDLGRDRALEDHLLRRILHRAGMDAAF